MVGCEGLPDHWVMPRFENGWLLGCLFFRECLCVKRMVDVRKCLFTKECMGVSECLVSGIIGW
jgi:hypothetical protein